MSREFQNSIEFAWYATSRSACVILPPLISWNVCPENWKLYRWWSIDHEPFPEMRTPSSVAAMMSASFVSFLPAASDTLGIRWNAKDEWSWAYDVPREAFSPIQPA